MPVGNRLWHKHTSQVAPSLADEPRSFAAGAMRPPKHETTAMAAMQLDPRCAITSPVMHHPGEAPHDHQLVPAAHQHPGYQVTHVVNDQALLDLPYEGQDALLLHTLACGLALQMQLGQLCELQQRHQGPSLNLACGTQTHCLQPGACGSQPGHVGCSEAMHVLQRTGCQGTAHW
eukprot:CAMPEP_0202897754 /NCGR_PEP_ID=MMETSP1392-20130828/6443_1 /ASSEMBLY_ACC=CAM_ASM_000868 /TAXON_ID=225041 /ORGANISM="Chlamydomonas chlamydogama, Strain SAG 11-48b" /LENGTH=174 /DNA_ID=CAMNT_0049583491 /DNA_START=1249 /DNA_END=1771 /DNA_ORIENTATION=-